MMINENLARQKFILNILLMSSIFLLSAASIMSCIDFIIHHTGFKGLDPTYTFALLFIFLILYFLSYKNHVYFCSLFLIISFYLLATLMGYRWGVDLPAEILLYSLTIIMTGTLISTRFAFLTTFIISITITIIGFLHKSGILSINRSWVNELWGPGEVTIAIAIFSIITIVSWLSNREIEKSLNRARKSEAELKKERDSLEITISKRTQKLKELQFEKMAQLYRFAEFGRLSTGLFHDLINPLNAISLNMEKVKSQKMNDNRLNETRLYLDRAISAARKMGDLVGALKKQISKKEDKKTFSLNGEIKQIIDILAGKASKADVEIIFNASREIELLGDSIKFNQIVLNLVDNAIDAYAGISGDNKQVLIYLTEEDNIISLTVKDYGIGIPKENLNKIFESFFTTKSDDNGLGIGLSMAKRFVEKDFNGTIRVESAEDKGTIFTVRIPRAGDINNFINQIKNYQQKDGGFLDASGTPSILYTSLIISCLNNCYEAMDIKGAAVNFLLSNKNDDWEFSKNINENFCALAAIAEHNKEMINGSGLAKILVFLTTIEVKEGGPYYSQDGIVDPITNASIARFLACYDVTLPDLESFKFSSINGLTVELSLEPTPALSAALLVENFCLRKESRGNNIMYFDESEQHIIDLIMEKAKSRLVNFSDDFQKAAIGMIQKVLKGNTDKQMSLMAYYTRQSLGDRADELTDDFIAELGLNNIFFWTAFIIYDDFWDEDESADPRLLPVANLYARSYIDFFNSILPEKTNFRNFFHKLMDGLDIANTWETINCRVKVEGNKFFIPDSLPDYGDYSLKFQPASGHILGPISIFVKLGYGISSPEVKNLIEYFKNYLIAMQINDDAHDWEEDMRRGHLSTVVTMLLDDLEWPRKEIDLDKDLDELKRVFWLKTMVKASQKVLLYTDKSRQALNQIEIMQDKSPLERFIIINEDVAKKALEGQKESADFLNKYEAVRDKR